MEFARVLKQAEERLRFLGEPHYSGLSDRDATIAAKDIDASEAFYRRLGLETVSDYDDYRLMDDGRGWRIHLRSTPDWPCRPVKRIRVAVSSCRSKVSRSSARPVMVCR